MPDMYPGFAGLMFLNEEAPVEGSDSGWNKTPRIRSYRTLNMVCTDPDIIRVTASGNASLSWEFYTTEDRYYQYQNKLCVAGTLTDWRKPVPQQRYVVMTNLSKVPIGIQVPVLPNGCPPTTRMVRARVEFTETGVSSC